MRKNAILLLLLMALFCLPGCENIGGEDTTLEISSSSDSGIPYFMIETNLPDETILEVTVSKAVETDNGGAFTYYKEENVSVKNGKAETGKFSDNGKSLSGSYSVSVSTLYMDEQPSSVQEATENGKKLKGDLVGTNQYLDNAIYVRNSEFFTFQYDETASIDSSEEKAVTNEQFLAMSNGSSGNGKMSVESMIQSSLAGIEKNTTDALDKISQIAKDNAENATDEQINEAISAIRDNYPQYYDGPEQMELYMYYGYLLDFAFDDSDPRSELGMDACQAIKYVYRNVETVLDDATKENLNQIEKDLQNIK